MKYLGTFVIGLASVFGCAGALAHCDTLEGPVLVDARLALEKGDVTPVLKWVMAAKEPEIRRAFDSTLAVRTKGPEARDLADRYFFETLVRVHREGEGAPYTGIKDEPVEPIVAMADKAIAGGSHEAMTRAIVGHLTSEIDAKYRRVLEASKTKDTSVAAGRAFVEAYVIYVHYVEGVHDAIAAAGGHEAHGR
jgi:hypothetical protein